MNKENIAHKIKHREKSNDEFYTPKDLAKLCVKQMTINKGDVWLESAYGTGNFFSQFPNNTINKFTKDFFSWNEKVDFCVTNPPYSKLDEWFTKTCEISTKGFGLLIGWNNLTARRIEMCNKQGFGISKILMFKVFKWFGMSCFVIFEKNKKNIIQIERTVWREDS